MAKYIGLAGDEPTENSEQRVAKALKQLSDDWIVLHHVSWQSMRHGRQGDGEADFIAFHPKKGLLVIEVKGGGVEIDDGRWYTTDRHGLTHSIKNPYEQARDSKHALLGWLRDHGLAKVRLGHAVIFPHMDVLPNLGPNAPVEISFTKAHFDQIQKSIESCVNHWGLNVSLTNAEADRLVDLLAPTIKVSTRLSSLSADAEDQILLLTAEQVDVFAGLRARRGATTVGGAGTGKTILAIARAQQLARDGFRTLLVCYNELLGEQLSTRVEGTSANLTACTYHSLCLKQAYKARIDVPQKKTRTWWEHEAPNLLIEACAINDGMYDAIVIDEGQDFSPLWLASLQCLISIKEDAPFFIFVDPHQDIWKREWDTNMGDSFTCTLSKNMRNTDPIASCVNASVNGDCKGRGILGPNPNWITATEPSESDVIVAVEDFIDEGFGPHNLVVICGSLALTKKLKERSVGHFSFGAWGSQGIPVETISRFKGLESQAVVLVLPAEFSSQSRVEAYVGMSRARSVLAVIGSDAIRKDLSWPIPMS